MYFVSFLLWPFFCFIGLFVCSNSRFEMPFVWAFLELSIGSPGDSNIPAPFFFCSAYQLSDNYGKFPSHQETWICICHRRTTDVISSQLTNENIAKSHEIVMLEKYSAQFQIEWYGFTISACQSIIGLIWETAVYCIVILWRCRESFKSIIKFN